MAWHRWVRNDKYPEIWTAVYRLLDAGGRLLYVGIGRDYLARWKMHAKTAWWAAVVAKDVTWYPNRLAAAYEESRAIREEAPIYNVRPGIDPIGMIVFERVNDMGHWECPACPEMVVSAPEREEVLRLFDRGRVHAAVVVEGDVRGVLVPGDWYQQAGRSRRASRPWLGRRPVRRPLDQGRRRARQAGG